MDYWISPGELVDKAQAICDHAEEAQRLVGEAPDELERLMAGGDLINQAMQVYEELDFAITLAQLRIKAIINEAQMR